MLPTTDYGFRETPMQLQAIGRGATTIMTVPERNWKQRCSVESPHPAAGDTQKIILTGYRQVSMLTFVCIRSRRR